MAIEFIEAVWQISPYKAEKLLVQLACADWANADGEFWPTYDEISRKARVTKPGAIGIVEQLLTEGEFVLVEKGGGRGKTNHYRFSDDYLETVASVRQAWAKARERKGKRALPNQVEEKVNQDDSLITKRVNENDEKGKPELSHIRKNRQEPSERDERTESASKPKLALVSSVGENPHLADQPFSPNDDFSQAAPRQEWTVGERFVLKACGLWDDLANQEKPIVETSWKTKQAVQSAGKYVAARLDVAKKIGGTPKMFLEFWHDELKRLVTPRPDYVVEQWEAYDRWLIANYETHRRVAA